MINENQSNYQCLFICLFHIPNEWSYAKLWKLEAYNWSKNWPLIELIDAAEWSVNSNENKKKKTRRWVQKIPLLKVTNRCTDAGYHCMNDKKMFKSNWTNPLELRMFILILFSFILFFIIISWWCCCYCYCY